MEQLFHEYGTWTPIVSSPHFNRVGPERKLMVRNTNDGPTFWPFWGHYFGSSRKNVHGAENGIFLSLAIAQNNDWLCTMQVTFSLHKSND